MNVIEVIRTKRAVRKYRDEPLPEDIVHTILHAGRRAQSAKNDQLWHFLAIRSRATLWALQRPARILPTSRRRRSAWCWSPRRRRKG